MKDDLRAAMTSTESAVTSHRGSESTNQEDHGWLDHPDGDHAWDTYEDVQELGRGADAVPIDLSKVLDANGKVSLRRLDQLLTHAEHVSAANPKVVFFFLGSSLRSRKA